MTPRFSFKVAPFAIGWPELSAVWREADAAGFFHAGWVFDHFYPSRGPIRPMWESWTVLAALAAVTERLRLGVMVSSNTFRHPALLAHMAGSVDHVSNGRLEIGLGVGWNEVEHAAFGLDLQAPDERWARFAEALEILDGLLTQDSFSFSGDYFRLVEATLAMRGVQRPRPPLVIGGIGPERTLPLVARWADHWNYFDPESPPEALRSRLERVWELCSDLGRDPDEIEVSAQMRMPATSDELTDLAGAYLAAGAHHIVVTAFPPVNPETVPGIAEALRPHS
jgi:F420-dependent oxidoreductase-like protein